MGEFFTAVKKFLTKETLSPQEVAEKIQAVKAEEIMAVAKDIFKTISLISL